VSIDDPYADTVLISANLWCKLPYDYDGF